jgi:hypothetical protein
MLATKNAPAPAAVLPMETAATKPPRLVNIGSMVWIGVDPVRRMNGETIVALPAIVLRVKEHQNPRTTVAVVVFGAAHPTQVVTHPYSDTLAVGCWSWPTDVPPLHGFY